MEPRSIARRQTGVLKNALWSAADAVDDRVCIIRFDPICANRFTGFSRLAAMLGSRRHENDAQAEAQCSGA
jgi:hypothetical protein